MTDGPGRFLGRTIPDPGFAGDAGGADDQLVAALRRYAEQPGRGGEVLAALARTRLLVPVVAVLEAVETGDDGLRQEKQSAMATVTVTGPDGRRALLAFTSTSALAQWRADARPVAVTGPVAAQAALSEQADSLLVDPAGPAAFAVGGAELRALALGGGPPADDPRVERALRACVAAEPDVVDVSLGADPESTTVQLSVTPGLGPDQLAGLLRRVSQALADDLVLRTSLSSRVRLSVLPADPSAPERAT